MYKIEEAIIVEGNYDKNKLSQFIDGTIITTHGFAVYSNEEFINTIRTFAKATGIVILTDSDSAGLRIRNFIKDKVREGVIKHAYIPDVQGKERRKRKESAEGLLGVEGMSEAVIIDALKSAGATIDNVTSKSREGNITKADLYMLGLSGAPDSKEKRRELARKMSLPEKLSSNMLLDCINRLYTYDELVDIIQRKPE